MAFGSMRNGRQASAAAAIIAALIVVIGSLAPNARAQTADPSDVVLVFDFSASILKDKTNRVRFATTLEGIATRIDAIAPDLVAGDATVSIVRFAARAVDTSGCVDLKLLNSPETVSKLANCLRGVAQTYRRGVTPKLTKLIGVDTNYVAAMQRAATHLPADSVRPTLILFTDGRHDVKGVPVSQVQPTRDRLFGSRSPFALLPVGMGLDPKLRAGLTAGLERLRITESMPACVSGATFEWPTVTFQTAAEAGNAVAVALQDATCTFSVAPTPSPSPTPAPQLAAIVGFRIVPGDGTAQISWTAAPTNGSAAPVADWKARCRTGAGDWIESSEGVSTDPKATVAGLTNGTVYECEVAAIGAGVEGPWTPAGLVTPLGVPAPPEKPSVSALNGAVQVTVASDQAGVSSYNVECSPDNGATWPATIDTASGATTTIVGGLTDGTEYVCRSYAKNAVGISAASPVSDSVRPCSSLIECNPLVLPIFGGLAGLLALGVLLAFFALYRGRVRGYVIAVVDVVHTANIGHGSTLGIAFVRAPGSRELTGIVADKPAKSDLRIRRKRSGGFIVRDRAGRYEVEDGDPLIVSDGTGGRHSLVLRAFDTNAASQVATRR